jgi:ketosteroid isomerase-like protein
LHASSREKNAPLVFNPSSEVGSIVNGEHPNALAYRRAADAFPARDLRALELLIADDVVWHVPGNHPMAGDDRGCDALLAWLQRVADRGFWIQEHDVFGNDEHVCALSYMGAQTEGVDVRTRVVRVSNFRDGRQAERWFYQKIETPGTASSGRDRHRPPSRSGRAVRPAWPRRTQM